MVLETSRELHEWRILRSLAQAYAIRAGERPHQYVLNQDGKTLVAIPPDDLWAQALWLRWHGGHHAYRRCHEARTRVGVGMLVSTVFLGSDVGPESEPLMWETLVFKGASRPHRCAVLTSGRRRRRVGFEARSSSRADALGMHLAAVLACAAQLSRRERRRLRSTVNELERRTCSRGDLVTLSSTADRTAAGHAVAIGMRLRRV